MSADLFDTYVSWLTTQKQADIVVLEETHWGMGRTPNTWTRDGWHFISSPSPHTRYAGICICVSERIVGAEDLDFRDVIPGRLVHVRIHNPFQDASVDIVGVYQWVKQTKDRVSNAANRSKLWAQLGRTLDSLPRRNVLLLAGDFNSHCCRLDHPRRTPHLPQQVQHAVAHMWETFRTWRRTGRHNSRGRRIFQVWRRFAAFRAASKALRQASVQSRRQRVHDLIDRAAHAASKDQLSELYKITKILAPKRRMERVLIRAPDGSMLKPAHQFEAILQYFSKAFSDPNPFSPDDTQVVPAITADVLVDELLQAAPQFAYIAGKSIDSAIIRAAGEVSSNCYGAVMIGIDLSRAFDNLTRDVLQRSLQHAGVNPGLQRILLEIHQQCSYELRHHQYKGRFPLKKGVRQGCAVSPMLYSLFTVWLMAELKTRVSPQWVDELMTCFADDTHLAWRIFGQPDLAQMCRTVREIFQLLEECGMVANAEKSSVVLGLRGSLARKWIKLHTVMRAGKTCINFGTPNKPLLIPRVSAFGYLGVQVSYGAFESQTLACRQQAASANRMRLAKLLHSKRIALKRRLSLYLSCVRSSLLFGLHATGFTEAVLRRLDALDSRHLRAIAHSPAHITHESTLSLRKRLKVSSPAEALTETAPMATGLAEMEKATVARKEIEDVWGKLPQRMETDQSGQEKRGQDKTIADADRQNKWPKPAYKGSYGKGQSQWRGWDNEQEEDTHPAVLDEATTHLLRTLTKLTLRLEEEMGRFRADTCFMLFVDTVTEQNTLQLLREAGQKWQEGFEAGTVTTSLRIILLGGLLQKLHEVLDLVISDDGLRERLMKVGWLSEGATALTPMWHYYRWDPEARAQVKDEKPPLSHERVLHCVSTLQKTLCDPQVLLRFRATHPLGEETQAEVVPFKMAISLRGQASVEAFMALSALSYCGALKLLGLRLRPERMQKSKMASELEEAYLNTSFTDWTRRKNQWRRNQNGGKPQK
ncbi:jockey\pol [Symbiodinium sp. CCMP2592]|nr:jockey\pol [Symbiodinium sp. CCMP2592]